MAVTAVAMVEVARVVVTVVATAAAVKAVVKEVEDWVAGSAAAGAAVAMEEERAVEAMVGALVVVRAEVGMVVAKGEAEVARSSEGRAAESTAVAEAKAEASMST